MSKSEENGGATKLATAAEAPVIARLLHRFNLEFDQPSPGVGQLAPRIDELIRADRISVFLAGASSDEGVAVVRFQPSIWSKHEEAYLAELYVVPDSRRRGFGGRLLDDVLELSRERNCEWIYLGTNVSDTEARKLYERFGFTNLESGPNGPDQMLWYEREL